MVKVEDVDAHHDHALERGARIVSAPADYPYGERQYSVEDLAGHRWTFTQAIADLAPEDWGGNIGVYLNDSSRSPQQATTASRPPSLADVVCAR